MHRPVALVVAGLCAITALSLSAPSLRAQASAGTVSWLDGGGARLEQPGSVSRSAATLGAGVWHARRALGGGLTASVEGGLTLTSDSVGAAQYQLRGGYVPERARWSRTELDVSATTIGVRAPGMNGNRAALLRQIVQHDVGALSVAWQASVGVGRTERPGIGTFDFRVSTVTAEGHAVGTGVDVTRGPWSVGVAAQRAFSDDWPLVEAAGGGLQREARYYTFDDATVALTYSARRLTLAASASWRAPRSETLGSARGAAFMAAWQVSRDMTLVAQAGEQLADLVRGVPHARYSAVAVRWQPLRGGAFRRASRASDAARGVVAGTPGSVTLVPDVRGAEVLLTRREGEGRVTLTIEAPRDAVVELSCSASEWAPVRLTTHDGRAFTYVLTLPTGSHKLAVRVNGGTWRAPRGLAETTDDYQGTVGVVVVP